MEDAIGIGPHPNWRHMCVCGHFDGQHIYDTGACRPGWECLEHCESFQREAGRSAKPDTSLHGLAGDGAHISIPVLSRHENNQSDARMLAEDAAGLCRHWRTADDLQLAQAKALASIALSMAFGGAS